MKRETVLHVSDVAITTATVEIQVIRIGAKQMTLAVFRQLPHKDIFDDWGSLLADPWGWINYDWNGPQQPFIYSYDGVLYRCNVNIKECDSPKVLAQSKRQWNSKHSEYDLVATGKWIVAGGWDRDYSNFSGYEFESESGAKDYLQYHLKSVATLKTAPQLFIAV